MRCLSLSGVGWAKKTGIVILGTPTIMTVGMNEILIATSWPKLLYMDLILRYNQQRYVDSR